jgi:ferredoxin-NADP reductase
LRVVTTALRFVRRLDEGENVASFVFDADRPLGHRAGQAMRLTVPHPEPDDRGISRTFTISSAPSEPFAMISTRLSEPPSTFKRALRLLEPGAVVEARGPYGRFVYAGDDRPAVFVAGGIGVTPFRSMLVELASQRAGAPVTLLYANRSPDIPFRALFDGLARHWPGLRIVYTVTRPTPDWRGQVGRVDEGMLRRHVPNLSRPLFYVSGPAAMVEATAGMLSVLGVGPDRVKRESFPGYGAPAGTAGSPANQNGG